MFKKVFSGYFIVSLIALLAVTFISADLGKNIYFNELNLRLSNTVRLVREIVAPGRKRIPEMEPKIMELGKSIGARITVIGRDGRVLADSEQDPENMLNHNNRPEIIAARASGLGKSTRLSSTLAVEMKYLAVPLDLSRPDGEIIRIALPLNKIKEVISRIHQYIAAILIVLALTAILASFWMAKKVIRPINRIAQTAQAIARGDFSQKIVSDSKDEIGMLGDSINKMSDQLQLRFNQIREKSDTLNTVMESISDGIIAIDRDLKIILVNSAAGRLFGFQPEKSAGRPLWETVRHDQFNRFVKEAITQPAETSPARLETVSSENRHLRIHCQPIGGIPGTFALVIYDITEQSRYEQLRKDFVANVSHELRTPLTFIKGYAETLREEGAADPAKSKEFLEIIENNASQLANLIQDLLEISRLESKAGIARLKPAPLRKLLERSVSNLQPAIKAKKHNVSVTVSPVISTIRTDPDMLEKAVSNLIENAIKYTPDGGKIEISAAPEPDKIAITVKDNGLGIPEEDRERIFERFYRVDKSRSREMGGTGLGLSIVKHIAQTLGGEITVQSNLGRGSAFTLKILVQ